LAHEASMRNIIFIYMRSIVLFICGGGLFIIYNALYFLIEITLDKYSYYEPLFIYDMYSSMFKSMSNEPVV